MAAKRYWEVATIRRFAIYVNNWETFGTEGQWPLSGGGRYTEVAAIRGSTVYLKNIKNNLICQNIHAVLFHVPS